MIYGIGCDITKISRFEKWVQNESMIDRFYNPEERPDATASFGRKCEFYAGRFPVKEALSKALGSGIFVLNLKEICVRKNTEGKPELLLTGKTRQMVESRCGKNFRVHISISHEKEYALAYAVIECGE
mgnify:CR=1 FL=1